MEMKKKTGRQKKKYGQGNKDRQKETVKENESVR